MLKESATFYVYEHWRPDTGLPFYVGKGKDNRASRTERNQRHGRTVSKLRRSGLDYEIRKIFTGLNEEMAFGLEKSQISYWRARGIDLTNLTPGGEGTAGYKWTDEQLARKRAMLSTPEARAQLALQAKDAMARPEVKVRHSAAIKAWWAAPQTKQKIKDYWNRWRKNECAPRAFFNVPEGELAEYSLECKERMARPDVRARHSAALKEAWARNREVRMAIYDKPEVKANLRASAKVGWETRRKRMSPQSVEE